MQLATTRPDETLEELAARVYDLGDKPTQTAERAAVRALAEANPFLRKGTTVAAGTVVAVPPPEQGQVRAEATTSEDALAGALAGDHVLAAVDLLARQLTADLEADAADAEETVKRAKDAELKRAKATGLAEALRQATAAAEARRTWADELRTRQAAVLDQIAADVEQLAGGTEAAA
jgi:flagellar biosynthesis/type III secretory pathway protein FliH